MARAAHGSRAPTGPTDPGTRTVPTAGPPLEIERLDPYRWRIARDERRGMRVEGIVYADDRLMRTLRDDPALQQVANVATLPGIVGASLAMPDVHWGYGFPVGGVAATELEGGVVSPGGIGFDINCGVRIIRTELTVEEIRAVLPRLADALFAAVPSGVGARAGRRLRRDELDEVLRDGSRWAVGRGLGWADDLERTEEGGRLDGADPAAVSVRAHDRGADQLGTLGSGNHFLEVEVVDEIGDAVAAEAFGLRPGQVVVSIHCGSRGLGHQVCTDHVAVMDRTMGRYGIRVPDRQLACAPLGSGEARAYLGAMAAASNFAWANRQLIAHHVRGAFERILGRSAEQLGMRLVYDLSHNIAKLERHRVGGRAVEVCVHRKGATRAFPAGHPDVPEVYRSVGQPVFVPGDMGRYSYVAVGAPGAMEQTFGSTCHGAGRNLSRHAALRELRGVSIADQLERAGILVRAERYDLLAEEASLAYKDVATVIEVAEGAGPGAPGRPAPAAGRDQGLTRRAGPGAHRRNRLATKPVPLRCRSGRAGRIAFWLGAASDASWLPGPITAMRPPCEPHPPDHPHQHRRRRDMFRPLDAESSSPRRGRTPVTCVACGCRLEAATGARDGEYRHFGPFAGRDARGCRVDCVTLVHDATGRPVLASIA